MVNSQENRQGQELAALFQRDLTRLGQELERFPDDAALWERVPGVQNAAGNLMLHLEGNLREYIGRQLGGVDYARNRKQEFTAANLTRAELRERIGALAGSIPEILARLSSEDLEKTFPEQVFSTPMSTRQFVIHLHGHFNYHLGQVDYLRRVLTQEGAANLVQL